MRKAVDQLESRAATRADPGVIFVSLELSKSTWLVTSLAPGSGKMSRHSITGGDIAGLIAFFTDLRKRAHARLGKLYPLVVIQEAGLDGFWIHRVLDREDWIESHVVDAASIAVSRRHRRAKTDRIDGEALIRTLLAYKRGEPRVCSMVRVPTPEEEDRRRICVTSLPQRLPAGFTNGSRIMAGGSKGQRSWPSPENCSSRSGSMSRQASSSKGQ